MAKGDLCAAEGCGKPHYSKTWCRTHYRRLLNFGDPHYVRPLPPPAPTEQRCHGCKQTLNLSAFAKNQKMCRQCRKERYAINNYSAGKRCRDCNKPQVNTAMTGQCNQCRAAEKRRNAKETRYINAQGYAVLTGHYDHPNRQQRGQILEHVFVMAQKLGRPLVTGENVHHINGVRDDNRPENLELWSRSQPPGQRIADKVEWAKELLSLYEPEALAEPMMLRVVS